MSKSSSRVDDQLWKSILEQTFAHFLEFFFENAAGIFDLSKPFDYLDKEFESLFPPEPNGKGVRFVDKLVKVYLKDGGEQFVLCHIEVQSSRGKGDLAERMFRYYYKISDKYQVPISAIAILADDNRSYYPSVYVKEFMGTILHYRFNSYKVLHQDEVALRSNKNPFSVVVLTTLLAITNKNISDDKLKDIKHDLYEQMMSRKMDKSTRQGLYNFLTYYVGFENQGTLTIFESEIEKKLGRSSIMGTQEYLLDKAEKQGIEKGMEKGEREKAISIALEFKKMGLPVADIAKGTGLSIEEIEKLK
ncbi:Rpn family recombination-promoting nuclease/putative transposase [Sphingobacterium anhuiense]|uniref:Rpn family recombination-promoting nuclease/putative transposase n=1 Tax=Sphingobacterium anhuiense TaxID=493780 RepID=A0ABW5YTH5_9SPHI